MTASPLERITDAGWEADCLDDQVGNWDQATAQQFVANSLSAHPETEVVFCNNDAMALGALQSIEAAGHTVGKDIYLVGVDALTEALENVLSGKMTGTVFNDHIAQSHSAADDRFLTANNFLNILMNMSARLVIALGISGCVITGGCDLSAGRMIGLAACIAGTLLQKMDYSGKFFSNMKPMNIFIALLIVLAVTGFFGSITGFSIAFLHIPPFIATLAMMEIVYGIALIYTGATPLGGYTTEYTNLATGKFLGISYLIWIAILIAAGTWFLFNMTRHGKYMYALSAVIRRRQRLPVFRCAARWC